MLVKERSPTCLENQLLSLLKERCYQYSENATFILSSGRYSRHYIDIKKAFMFSKAAYMIGEVIWDRVFDCDGLINAIGGPEIGSIPITTAAVSYAYSEYDTEIEGFIVRDVMKQHGTKKIIEGILPHNAKVVIVDDVVTSGNSIMRAVYAVRNEACESVQIITLVDRLKGAKELFEKEGIPFQSIFTINDFRKS